MIMNKLLQMLMAQRGLMAPEPGEGGGGGGESDMDDLDFLFEQEDDEAIDDLLGDTDPEPEPEPEPEPSPEPEPEPQPEPEPEPKPEQTGDDPEPTPEPEPEPQPTPEPEPEPEPEPQTPTQEELEARQAEFLAEVEKEFAISEDDANMIIEAPEKILPKLATKIYDRAMRDAHQMIMTQMQAVPQMMQQHTASMEQQRQISETFDTLNPELKGIPKSELNQLIESYGPMLAKSMKGKPQEEILRAIGVTIATTRGIQLGGAPQPAPAPEPKPQPVKPHTPSSPRGAADIPDPKGNANPDDDFITMLIDSQYD
jgi:chemotaxis protein histidine kinase CheA